MNWTGLPTLALGRLRDRIRDGRVLERDPSPEGTFDAKVVVTDDGLIFKFFRVRRFWSSNLIRPYARRFSSNASRLRMAGVGAPHVQDLFYVPEVRRQVAVYRWIDGETVRARMQRATEDAALHEELRRLGRFLAELHAKGICFEGGHLNNYLRTADGGHALIDVTDVVFYGAALTPSMRMKNLRKLARHPDDATLVLRAGWEPLLEGYRQGGGAASGMGV